MNEWKSEIVAGDTKQGYHAEIEQNMNSGTIT